MDGRDSIVCVGRERASEGTQPLEGSRGYLRPGEKYFLSVGVLWENLYLGGN